MSGSSLNLSSLEPITAPNWEKHVLLIAFITYVIWQINAVLHHGGWAQDFGAHVTWIEEARDFPMTWFTHYDAGRTNPPLYHYLASLVFHLTYSIHSIEIFGVICVGINVGALCLLYRIIKQMVLTPTMRVACMIFILFVPFAMIQTVVIAADGLATILFITILYVFTLLTKPNSKQAFVSRMLVITLLLTIAQAIKFTFLSLIPACILAYAVLYHARNITGKQALMGAVAVLLIPGVFGAFQFHNYQTQVKYNLGMAEHKDIHSPINSPFINLRSILAIKSIDKKLLSAPPYNYSEDGERFYILQPNHFSYPALLHLAIFTDILNAYQYDPEDNYFGPRSESAQSHMKTAVRTGLIFSIYAAFAIPLMILWCTWKVWRRQENYWTNGVIIALLSCAFYFNIVAFLPFIPAAYSGGYWLPRLVAPALICFIVLTFAYADRVVIKRMRFMGGIILLLVVLQSFLHLSFLWPWGSTTKLHGTLPLVNNTLKL